jgi:hypothetical protein
MEISMLRRFLFVFILATCCSAAIAQSTSASLTGLVEDPSKALIPGATITAINTQTGEKASTTTNKEGQYVLPGLNPGTYRLEVDKPGFKAIIEAGLTLHVQDAVQINFHMAIGSSAESVTVTADQINMNTTDGSVSTVIDQTYIANMPLNGRSLQDLILLVPGVLTTSPQQGASSGNSGEFTVNGQRTEENYYTVDGVGANVGITNSIQMSQGVGLSGTLPGETALGTTQALVSLDDLQEFRATTSTYSAEYGRNPGGQFAFETKSGSNQWHGSLYDYLRNGFFDARDWFNGFYGVSEPEIHQNDFGGTVGGPVRIPKLYNGRDKTFFFVSYEALRLLTPQAATLDEVPDLAFRASVPSSVAGVINAFPLPNGNELGSGIAQYIGSWSNRNSINAPSVRIDHVLSDKMSVFFRFSDTGSYFDSRQGASETVPNGVELQPQSMRTYTFGATNSLTQHIENQFRLNYTANYASAREYTDSFGGATALDLLQAGGLPETDSAWLALNSGPYYLQIVTQGPVPSYARQWNAVDSVSLAAGHHRIKLGLDYRRLTSHAAEWPDLSGWYFANGLSDFQANTPQTFTDTFADITPLYQNFSLYAEDEWHVSRRLSLSLGLRWDVNPPPSTDGGVKPWTLEGSSPATLNLAPYGTPPWHTTWFNIAPRFGGAYILRDSPGWETVVRAGGGQFFDTGQQLGSLYFDDGLGTQSSFVFYSNYSYPNLPPPVAIPNPPVAPYGNVWNVNYANPHLQLPYTLQWNVSAQQALGKMQSVTLSYVGSHADRLLEYLYIQDPNDPYLGGSYGYVSNGLTSDYNALQAQFQRRLSAGLTAIASYTYSHCFDYGSDNLTNGYKRGNCDFDVRQNFSAAFSWNVPSVKRERVLEAVVNNWGLDQRIIARTAFPVTLAGPELFYPNGQTYNAGVNIVPGQPVYIYGSDCISEYQKTGALTTSQVCPGGRGINPNAFVPDDSGLGNAPRNVYRGFGALQFNSAVRREFPISEKLRLQFRGEAFNIFNHPNFGTINGVASQANFGLATATLANSLGGLSSLYQMGGARSLQFALKLLF